MAEKKVITDFSNKDLDKDTQCSSNEELVDVFEPMEVSEARKRGYKVVYKRIGIIKYSGIITKGTKNLQKNTRACSTMKLMQQSANSAVILQTVKVDLSCAQNVIHVVNARKKKALTSLEIIHFH